jgi:hypothetical protein
LSRNCQGIVKELSRNCQGIVTDWNKRRYRRRYSKRAEAAEISGQNTAYSPESCW